MTNQAVVFTKPLHHLGIDLSPEELDEETRRFLESHGLAIMLQRRFDGPELARRQSIRQHYLLYSKASYGDFAITEKGRSAFEAAFGRQWDAEVAAGRIMGNPCLMEAKGINAHELFLLWNERFADKQTRKLQTGLVTAWLDGLECYCVNAFYPAMEANFHDPKTRIDYYVVEFDPGRVSWQSFRKDELGATDASRASPNSLRGSLYARFKIDFPARDNFVHGSAGPFEGMVERTIHEADFEMSSSPVGRHLAARGIGLPAFRVWKERQSIADLGALFDVTEEHDTDDALSVLDKADW